MGEADRVLRELYRLHAAPVARVAKVDEDAEPVHLLDEADAEVAQPSVAALHAAVPGFVPEVVCKLHYSEAHVVGDPQEVEVPLQEAAVLGTEDDPVFSLPLRLLDVRGLPYYESLLLLLLRPLAVLDHLPQRVRE